MAKRSVKRDQIEIDPRFDIPEGVDEFVYTPNLDAVEEDVAEYTVDDSFIEDDEPEDSGDELDVPQILEVVSQTLRTSPTGQQVVDLVIEVEDVEGAYDYDLRVTKI